MRNHRTYGHDTIHALEDFAERCGLELEPFQRRILRAVASGTREVAILLARGNGKTALMALVAVHHLVTVQDAKVVVAASSRDQATNLFAYADRFARALGDPHVVYRYLELRWYPDADRAAKHGTYWSRSADRAGQSTRRSCTA
jgi:phage terminase large subunit-like protein